MSKLKRCSSCRTDIIKTLKHCPHCGSEQSNPFLKCMIVVVFVFILSVGIVVLNYLN